MTYSYVDEKGNYVGHGPNISGLQALSVEIAKSAPRKIYPHLNVLMKMGVCDDPRALKGECDRFVKKVKDKDVRDSLLRLARAAARAKEQLVITD